MRIVTGGEGGKGWGEGGRGKKSDRRRACGSAPLVFTQLSAAALATAGGARRRVRRKRCAATQRWRNERAPTTCPPSMAPGFSGGARPVRVDAYRRGKLRERSAAPGSAGARRSVRIGFVPFSKIDRKWGVGGHLRSRDFSFAPERSAAAVFSTRFGPFAYVSPWKRPCWRPSISCALHRYEPVAGQRRRPEIRSSRRERSIF